MTYIWHHVQKLGMRYGTLKGDEGGPWGQAGVPQGQVFLGLVWPRLPRSAVSLAVGALGALVMPHNIYFHSAIVNARSAFPAFSLLASSHTLSRHTRFV